MSINEGIENIITISIEYRGMGTKQTDKIISCPCCGESWNISKYNACQCGAARRLEVVK